MPKGLESHIKQIFALFQNLAIMDVLRYFYIIVQRCLDRLFFRFDIVNRYNRDVTAVKQILALCYNMVIMDVFCFNSNTVLF